MIKVRHAPSDIPGYWPEERCCFCSAQTRYRHEPTGVACCESCARVQGVSAIPSKTEWLRRHREQLGVLVSQDPTFGPGDPLERCCLCRQPTLYWCTENDVACCTHCAPLHTLAQIPSKKEWLAKERALTRRPWQAA